MLVLNPLTVPLLGPPRIEKFGCAPDGSVHESDTATEPPPCGAVAETLEHTGSGGANAHTPPPRGCCRPARRPSRVCPSDESATPTAEESVAGLPAPLSFVRLASRLAPDRVNSQRRADRWRRRCRRRPAAVLPSRRERDADRRIGRPTAGVVGPRAWSCSAPGGSGAGEHPGRAADACRCRSTADQGGGAGGREGDRAAEARRHAVTPHRWGANLRCLARSNVAAGARVHPRPRRPLPSSGAADQRDVAVGRERATACRPLIGVGASAVGRRDLRAAASMSSPSA